MKLMSNSYGKSRVRVLRLQREQDRHDVHEATVKVMLEGDFERAFRGPDNATTVATDSIKNIVNVTARENLRLGNEEFGIAITKKFLDRYEQVESVHVDVVETQWQRLVLSGRPHDHSFTKAGNGNPTARIRATRDAVEVESGVTGFTFMKTTGSAWTKYIIDEYTTIPETEDRIAATSMDATWRYARRPADFTAANDVILQAMLEVFATTYSVSIQDSMYRMGCAALKEVAEISEVRMAMPNKHYLPMNLSPFRRDNPNVVFSPTDEPHG